MKDRKPQTAVLLMAYGSPDSLDEVEAYYTHLRGARAPSAELVDNLKERYRRVGMPTPLLEITRRQARALEARLGEAFRVYVGMRHWKPFIGEVMSEIVRDGFRRAVAFPLAPHYSHMSVGGYLRLVEEARQKLGSAIEIIGVKGYADSALLAEALAEKLSAALRALPEGVRREAMVVFTAHSLPERILREQDPYPSQIFQTAQLVAKRFENLASIQGEGEPPGEPLVTKGKAPRRSVAGGHTRERLQNLSWRTAYQSAGHTGEPWLGPDILEVLDEEKRRGRPAVVVAPIGFVSDHLEILYDLDIEAREHAEKLGLAFQRTECLNDSPLYVEALAAVVDQSAHSKAGS